MELVFSELNILEKRHYFTTTLTKSRVWVLTAQKPMKRSGKWIGKLVLSWMLATGRGGRLLFKGWLPPHWQSVGKSIYRQREGATCRSHLEIDSQLWPSSWNWSSMVWPALSWLFYVQLTFSPRVGFFPLFEAISYGSLVTATSGHHVVNLSTWWVSHSYH